MRFPIPTRFKVKHVALFAITLFLAQQVNGTTILFSLLTLFYVVFFVTAFNFAGGMAYPSGAWIFFNGTLSALIGLSYKNLLGEAGQSNLKSPNVTMAAYCLGMAMIGVAAYLTRRLRSKRPILTPPVIGDSMRRLAIGCLIFGLAFGFFGFLLPFQIYTAMAQLNRFVEMAIVLGTFYEIKASNGQRSANWIVWVAGLETFAVGVLGFTKEGMFSPLLAWLLPCVMLGYRFSRAQVVGIILTATFFFMYLAPYSQLARGESGSITSMSQNVAVAAKYLGDLSGTRKTYEDKIEDQDYQQGINLYDKPQGLLDRLQMIAFDDALITYTDNRSGIGIAPTYLSYLNLIPHFLYPGKPNLAIGNSYAREIGMLPESDTTTGISFSPIGDAYHQLKWFGIVGLIPLAIFPLFLLCDSLSGDIRFSPWGVVLAASLAHVAPEGVIEEQVHMTLFAPLAVILVALMARYVLPTFTAFFMTSRAGVPVARAPFAATPAGSNPRPPGSPVNHKYPGGLP